MEEDLAFTCRFKDVISNILGVVLFVIDLALDLLAVVTFYKEEAYVAMGVLIFFLLGSSLLVHTLSWLWYDYEFEDEQEGREYVYLEKYLTNRKLFGVLHLCQLAIFSRFAGVTEISLRSRRGASKDKRSIAFKLTHDLRFLRLIETYSENVPQLTLMLTVIVRSKQVELVTGLKTLVASLAITVSVLMFHRSMRSLGEEKAKMNGISSIVFFLWNFLLIVSRVAAVALFASIFPEMIAVHFILLWFPLFFWAWRQKTDFMDSPAGEWLFRGTVALILYFSWLKVFKGDSRGRVIIYHLFIGVDISILVLWWWHSFQDAFIPGLPAMWVCIVVGSCYIVGIVVKILYYILCHPKKTVTEESGRPEPALIGEEESDRDEVPAPPPSAVPMPLTEESGRPAPACMGDVELGGDEVLAPPPSSVPMPLTGAQKRMKRLADNFYS